MVNKTRSTSFASANSKIDNLDYVTYFLWKIPKRKFPLLEFLDMTDATGHNQLWPVAALGLGAATLPVPLPVGWPDCRSLMVFAWDSDLESMVGNTLKGEKGGREDTAIRGEYESFQRR